MCKFHGFSEHISSHKKKLNYKPKANFIGTDRLWYTIKDSQGRANSAGVTIDVTGVAAYPTANTDNITTTLNTARTFNALYMTPVVGCVLLRSMNTPERVDAS